MSYVTSLERIGIEKGISQGISQGITQGITQGFFKSIELLLNLKFGEEGLALLPQIQAINNQETLEKMVVKIPLANNLDEIIALINN